MLFSYDEFLQSGIKFYGKNDQFLQSDVKLFYGKIDQFLQSGVKFYGKVEKIATFSQREDVTS